MPKLHDLKLSSNTGEITPRLHARVDFNKYSSSCETLENMVPLAEGGAMRRAGTRYVAEIKSSAVKGRLKRFEFSTTQSYIIEMGEQAFRFYKNQGQIVSQNITASISNGAFPSNITGWTDRSGGGSSISHDSTNDRMSLISNGSSNAHAEQQVTNSSAIEHIIRFRVYGSPGDVVKLRVGTSSTGTQIVNDFEASVGFHTYAFTATAADFYVQFLHSTGKTLGIDDVSLIDNSPVELTTPYTEAQLFTVGGPQSADVLYLFHGSHSTYKLERRGHSTWSLVEVAWQDGPWLEVNTTTTTLAPSATTGLAITITASSTTGINGGDGFKSTDVGRLVRIDNPSSGVDWGWGIITEYTSATAVKVDIKRDFLRTNADTRWRLGAWSETTGYPSVGAFYEQRLTAANTTDQPQTFWMSNTGDFENHSPDSANASGNWDGTVQDDDSIDFEISADNVNAIRWLSAGEDTLSIGTSGGEWIPKSDGIVLTPSDISVRRQTTHGSAPIEPVRVDNIVLFTQRAKRKIREFGFTFESDGFKAFDMTRLAQHITRGDVVELAFAEEPDSQCWVVRGDGQLPTMTFRRQEDVVGWARHILGGYFGPATVTVTDYANIGVGTTLILTKSDGTTVTFTSEASGGSAPSETLGFRPNSSNDTTADNIFTAINAHADFTVANPASNVVTITETTHGATGLLTIASSDPVRLTATSEGNSVVESVASIPGTDGSGQTHDSTNRDEVWVIVKRTINGATGRYVEMFERDYEQGYDQEDAYYLDSLLTYDSSSTSTISGLSHLEGQTVGVYADGAIQSNKTVSSGSISLDSAASVVQVGLRYSHLYKTLKIEGGNPVGTAIGKKKRLHGITVAVMDSLTLKIGPDTDNLQNLDFRRISDPMDSVAPLFTGEKWIEFEGDWETDTRMVIQSDDPAPFVLLALAPELEINSTV